MRERERLNKEVLDIYFKVAEAQREEPKVEEAIIQEINKPDPKEVIIDSTVPPVEKAVETTVLKGKKRFNALKSAGVFPNVISWAINHRRLPGLSKQSDEWYKNLSSGELSTEDYKIIMKALQHSYSTGTANRETYDLFENLIPIYTIKSDV